MWKGFGGTLTLEAVILVNAFRRLSVGNSSLRRDHTDSQTLPGGDKILVRHPVDPTDARIGGQSQVGIHLDHKEETLKAEQ